MEEALYRASKDNWFIVGWGQQDPTVVLGIGGKVEALVDAHKAAQLGVPLVRRFTGGGTVVVDGNTLFTSIIGSTVELGCGRGPREIMSWTEKLYRGMFESVSTAGTTFALREHDYVFGDKKFGGSAQGLSRDRMVHHTSFLWDYNPGVMGLLRLPERRPDYRKDRPHSEFLCKLRDSVATPGVLEDAFVDCAEEAFHATFVPPEDLAAWVAACGHSPVTTVLSPPPAPPP